MIFTYSHYNYDGFSPFICRLQDDLQARAGLSFGTHRLVESGHIPAGRRLHRSVLGTVF